VCSLADTLNNVWCQGCYTETIETIVRRQRRKRVSMKVEAVPNRGPANLGAEIVHSLEWADQVDIASAFVTPTALVCLESALHQAQKEKRHFEVRLLFGLYQRFTPPQALDKMLKLMRAYPGQVSVRIVRNSRFHWKLYAFRKGYSRRFYIGSANLTEDGLTAEGELSVKIAAKSADSIAKTLESEFDSIWHDDSFPLTKTIQKNYRALKRPPVTFTNPQKDDFILKLLRNAEKAETLPVPTTAKLKPRIIFVDLDLKKETIKIISKETNWDKEKWTYIGNIDKSFFDLVVTANVFLFVSRNPAKPKEYDLELHQVRDTAQIETPNGKYFVAHSRVPGGRRLRYGDVKQELAKVGLTWDRIRSQPIIKTDQLVTLGRLLHIKQEKILALR